VAKPDLGVWQFCTLRMLSRMPLRLYLLNLLEKSKYSILIVFIHIWKYFLFGCVSD
jgi:hypothetical protein